MTREEFVTRTGLNPTDAAFEYINRVYMAAGDTMMKDDFCKEFKKNEGVRDSKIVEALTEQVESLNAGLESLAKQANTEMELRIKAASDMEYERELQRRDGVVVDMMNYIQTDLAKEKGIKLAAVAYDEFTGMNTR